MSLTLKLTLDNKEAEEAAVHTFKVVVDGTDEATKKTNAWATAVTGLNQAWEFGKNVYAFVRDTAGEAVEKVRDLVMETASYDKSVGRLAKTAGVSVETMNDLVEAGDNVNVSTQAIGAGLTAVTRQMFAASNGNKVAQAAFRDLGVEVTDSNGKLRNAKDVLLDMSDGLLKIDNPAQRGALAMKILKGATGELMPLLMQGKANIADMGSELSSLGIGATTLSVNLSSRLMRAIKDTKDSFEDIQRHIARQLLPAFTAAAEVTAQWAEQMMKATDWKGIAKNIQQVTTAAIDLLTPLLKIADWAQWGIQAIAGGFLVAAKAALKLAEGVFAIGEGFAHLSGGPAEAALRATRQHLHAAADKTDEWSLSLQKASSNFSGATANIDKLGEKIKEAMEKGVTATKKGVDENTALVGSYDAIEEALGGSGSGASASGVTGATNKTAEATTKFAEATKEADKAVESLSSHSSAWGQELVGSLVPKLEKASFDMQEYQMAHSIWGAPGSKQTGMVYDPSTGGMKAFSYADAFGQKAPVADLGNGGGGGEFGGFGGVREAGVITDADVAFEQVGGGIPGSGGSPGSIGRLTWGMGSVFEGQRYNEWMNGGYEQYLENQKRGEEARDQWNAQQMEKSRKAHEDQMKAMEGVRGLATGTAEANHELAASYDAVTAAAARATAALQGGSNYRSVQNLTNLINRQTTDGAIR